MQILCSQILEVKNIYEPPISSKIQLIALRNTATQQDRETVYNLRIIPQKSIPPYLRVQLQLMGL